MVEGGMLVAVMGWGAESVFVSFKGKPAACSGPKVSGRVREKEKILIGDRIPRCGRLGHVT
jgi:hypothetical protein